MLAAVLATLAAASHAADSARFEAAVRTAFERVNGVANVPGIRLRFSAEPADCVHPVSAENVSEGGTITVCPALADVAQSPDELVFVIAHEFGHVRHKHGLAFEAAHREWRQGLPAEARTLLDDGLRLYGEAFRREFLPRVGPVMREQELVADRYATDIAVALGSDATAGTRVVARMHEWSAKRAAANERVPRSVSHPSPEERGERIRQRAYELLAIPF